MKELFWNRFNIAEICGKETIKGVAEASFDEYKDDIEGLTWLVMVINHKSWEHHDLGNKSYVNYMQNFITNIMKKLLICLKQNHVKTI